MISKVFSRVTFSWFRKEDQGTTNLERIQNQKCLSGDLEENGGAGVCVWFPEGRDGYWRL